MRNVIALAVLLAASPVAAQAPGSPQSPTCTLTILRAPDDVRAVVEAWVRAEPRCTTALEVRIVPTEGGLYLLARDDAGRVRERVVPDAQSAGVLVASWVAADAGAGSTPAPAPAPVVTADPVVAQASVGTPAPVAGPAPPIAERPAIAAAAPVAASAPTATPQWLSLGGMFAMSGTGGGGIRGELDLKTRKYASLGVAASAANAGMNMYDAGYGGMSTLDTFDGKLLGYLSVNARFGRWHLRSAFGAGLVYTRARLHQWSDYSTREAAGVFPTGEVALTVGREIASRWAIYAGPIVSVYLQEYEVESSGPGYYSSSMQGRDLEAMMFIGVRHKL
jgi:hypothetical protein